MDNKQMKRCSVSLVIREMHIKTAVRYDFTPTRMAIILKCKIISVGKDVEKLEPSYNAGGNLKWCSHCGKQFGGSSKN